MIPDEQIELIPKTCLHQWGHDIALEKHILPTKWKKIASCLAVLYCLAHDDINPRGFLWPSWGRDVNGSRSPRASEPIIGMKKRSVTELNGKPTSIPLEANSLWQWIWGELQNVPGTMFYVPPEYHFVTTIIHYRARVFRGGSSCFIDFFLYIDFQNTIRDRNSSKRSKPEQHNSLPSVAC